MDVEERWPGEHAQLTRIAERRDREKAMLAAMTPEERDAWIRAWAERAVDFFIE